MTDLYLTPASRRAAIKQYAKLTPEQRRRLWRAQSRATVAAFAAFAKATEEGTRLLAAAAKKWEGR